MFDMIVHSPYFCLNSLGTKFDYHTDTHAYTQVCTSLLSHLLVSISFLLIR